MLERLKLPRCNRFRFRRAYNKALSVLLYWSVLHMNCAIVSSVAAEEEIDPYLWLEAIEDEHALKWVRERNAVTTAALTENETFTQLKQRLLSIMDSKERIPYINKLGNYYYNFWRDARHVRGIWRRTTLEEYRKAEPAWEIVLDLDALAASENENWVWKGASALNPEYERCLLFLSRGGADARVVREFDLNAKRFVEDGFVLPEAKSRVSWIDRETLFVATDFGPDSLTASGYPRIVKRWRRATPLAEAQTIFEGERSDVSVGGYRDRTIGFERDFVYRSKTFYTSEIFLWHDEKLIRIEKPESAQAGMHREWLLLELRDDWTIEAKTYPAGALLAIELEAFLRGGRAFEILFEPSARKSLAGYSSTKNYLLMNELENVRNRLYLLSRQNGQWVRQPVAGLPEFGTTRAAPVDSDHADDYFLIVTDYLTPTSLYLSNPEATQPEKLKQLPAFFDKSGLEVRQFEARSSDGTAIPYFQVSSNELPLDGSSPTLLYGYGGFEVPLVPGYSATVGAGWLEKKGVYVVANIRGGGEFGPNWHKAALKEHRRRAFEDFIAVAEHLIKRKVTSPERLGIQGGSNGGLLVGNMLTLRPELFGAIVCQVPLLDMRRYHKLLAGASWMGEYGDPDDPEQWLYLQKYSPYHNIKADIAYPPLLIATSTRDDRVHPGHARKMTARMLEQGHRVLYYENIEGGHGGAANNEQAAYLSALAYRFLWEQLTTLAESQR